MNFKIALGMIAYRAYFRCFGTYHDMSAVSALPYFHFTLLEHFGSLHVVQKLTISVLMMLLDFADHAEFLANPQLTRRPEQLSVKEFVALTNSVAEECGYVAEE